MCEDELGMDLSEFKSFLDQEMFTILGQMDSASKIFDYLYLVSFPFTLYSSVGIMSVFKRFFNSEILLG